MGRVGIKGHLLGFLMLKPSVANTQVMIPAKMIELEMIRIFFKILFCIGNEGRSES